MVFANERVRCGQLGGGGGQARLQSELSTVVCMHFASCREQCDGLQTVVCMCASRRRRAGSSAVRLLGARFWLGR